MRNQPFLSIALVLSLSFSLWIVSPASAAPPKPDPDNLLAYRLALEHSTDPQSQAIRQEIANGPADLARAKAAALKDGISLTLHVPNVPPDENASLLYDQWSVMREKCNQAYTQQHIHYPWYSDPLTLEYAYTPEQIATVRNLCEERPDINALMMEAVSKPYAFFPNPDPINTSPELAKLREAARQVRTEASLLALDGQWLDAAHMQERGFAIEKQASDEPSVLCYFDTNFIHNTAISGLLDILGHTKPDAALAAAVSRSVLASQNTLSLKTTLQGEAGTQLSSWVFFEKMIVSRHLPEVDEKTVPIVSTLMDYLLSRRPKEVDSPADLLFFRNLQNAFEARYLNQVRAAVDVAEEPPMQRRAAFTRQTNTAHALYKQNTYDPVSLFGEPLSFLVNMGKHDDIRAARDQITLAAAAVLTVKARTGSFPATLPGTFIDPFSGQPLIYKPDANGFLIYSVGPSGHFDGHLKSGHSGWESAFHYPFSPPIPVPKELL